MVRHKNVMNFPVLNRDFKKPADGWYHIAPRGEFAHSASGLTQVLDDASLAAIVNRFAEDSKAPNFGGLLIDFDHFSYDPEKSSEAAGWITSLENRNDGLWAQVRWSAAGDAAVTNGRYRFVSPVWLASDTQRMEGNRVRPMRLDTAGLTNAPNLKGMMPLSNRRTENADTETTKPKVKHMKEIAKLVGLAEEAAEGSICAEIVKLQNRAAAADAALKQAQDAIAPIKNRVTELETTNRELTDVVIEADLSKHASKFKPEAREAWKANLIANRKGTLALLESLTAAEPQKGAGGQAILNRDGTKTPAGEGKTFPQLVGDYMTANKVSKRQAVDAVILTNRAEHQAWLAAGGGML